ncbi:adenosylcobinamide-GDP ribazoletransferase [Luteibacter aegosomatis]|uniref:adenosylcobinamide-GDP ribazoletransferase n=1 Tax=Luteibacter aegosomatis TaxID=2911537 RepID=UPI001FFB806F|nr:adenosylcobinamide-GDP ribazoletransferase [Luteibacter aegosomatis]UPG86151.1 adenosylcobinamide-GDP ribazoletransferase [Luteibacter aegosomatis]
MMRGLLIAFGFLTRLPMPRVTWDANGQAASLKWYPLVGLVLGLLLALLAYVLHRLPAFPMAAIVFTAWVLLTGALHLDGLADSADAWVGGLGDRERTLSIMKDPRCGPAGVMSLVGVSLLKVSALTALPSAWLLLLPPLLARGALVGWFLTTPYVREHGLGDALRGAPVMGCRVAIVLTVVVTLCFGVAGAVSLLAAAFVAYVWRAACMRRIGGFTGDTAGAMVEMIEASVLLTLLIRF